MEVGAGTVYKIVVTTVAGWTFDIGVGAFVGGTTTAGVDTAGTTTAGVDATTTTGFGAGGGGGGEATTGGGAETISVDATGTAALQSPARKIAATKNLIRQAIFIK